MTNSPNGSFNLRSFSKLSLFSSPSKLSLLTRKSNNVQETVLDVEVDDKPLEDEKQEKKDLSISNETKPENDKSAKNETSFEKEKFITMIVKLDTGVPASKNEKIEKDTPLTNINENSKNEKDGLSTSINEKLDEKKGKEKKIKVQNGPKLLARRKYEDLSKVSEKKVKNKIFKTIKILTSKFFIEAFFLEKV